MCVLLTKLFCVQLRLLRSIRVTYFSTTLVLFLCST